MMQTQAVMLRSIVEACEIVPTSLREIEPAISSLGIEPMHLLNIYLSAPLRRYQAGPNERSV